MKTMTCRQLGGACELEFNAESFEEIAKLSQAHGKKMMEQKEPEHLKAMQEMIVLMQDPEALQKWMTEKRQSFENLPES